MQLRLGREKTEKCQINYYASTIEFKERQDCGRDIQKNVTYGNIQHIIRNN